MNPYLGKIVKVSRYGEAFWLRDVRMIEPGVFVGICNNDLLASNLFKFGDTIPFAEVEPSDVCDHKKPDLKVVLS